MIPIELKRDKLGLLYTDDVELIRYGHLDIDNRECKYKRYYANEFYSFPSTDDYIIKFSLTGFTRKERKKMLEMLEILTSKQKDVSNVDFPIGYYAFKKKINGLVIPYYKNGLSYDNILKLCDIEALNKYYAHDEDGLHNTMLLLNDLLDLVYEMFENGIYYTDLNPGNMMLTDNNVKLIDFDYRFIKFKNKDDMLDVIMKCYERLVNEVLKNYNLENKVNEIPLDFNDAKVLTKKIENKIRRG